MTENESVMEAEVLEIDGVPVSRSENKQENSNGRWNASWNKAPWKSYVKKIDLRYWPLLLIIGFFIAIVLLLLGSILLCAYLILKCLAWLMEGIKRLLR